MIGAGHTSRSHRDLYFKEREEKEQEMRLCGYLMLASVKNAGFIAFSYETEGKEYLVTVTGEGTVVSFGRQRSCTIYT